MCPILLNHLIKCVLYYIINADTGAGAGVDKIFKNFSKFFVKTLDKYKIICYNTGMKIK